MDVTHTSMPVDQLDRMLADAHRRGALEALDALAFSVIHGAKFIDVKIWDALIDEIRARYEPKEDK